MAFRKVQISNLQSLDTAIDDSIIVVGKSNTSPTDIGILGKIGINEYAGLVRDAETSTFYLIDSYTSSISNMLGVDANNVVQTGSLAVGTLEADVSIVVPSGTTVNRPNSPVAGQIWFNTDTSTFEGYDGSQWIIFLPATL
jgi:hypothetical protein